ncbi:MAG: class I SAM-dependent methyltransferase [Candidatus Bathyarchaeota archaeon]|nr:class I SAM-dependent methyltransferase [Candidatus Bathyarchaeota archaeon]
MGGRLYDERYRLEQTAKYDEILRHVKPSVDDIVLDDGCGTGLLLERLRSHAVGVDLSRSLLSTARSGIRKEQRTHLMQADADMLPLRDRVFDKVFAVTLIQNTPEPERALREIKRVARLDAAILVTALKKSFAPHNFKRLLNDSGMAGRLLVPGEELEDWLALAIPGH